MVETSIQLDCFRFASFLGEILEYRTQISLGGSDGSISDVCLDRNICLEVTVC